MKPFIWNLGRLSMLSLTLFLVACSPDDRFITHGAETNTTFYPNGTIIGRDEFNNIVRIQEPQKERCDEDLFWKHIYNQNRLKLIDNCIEVTGVIQKKVKEKDGDLHLQLRLDDKDSNLLNQANIEKQNNSLVIEVICVGNVTQEDAIKPCSGYVNQVYIPNVGEHVRVIGDLVEDTQHFNWREVHPVYNIEVIP